MEISTLIGLVIGLGALVGGMLMDGGTFAELIKPSAFVIVIGGTLGATLVAYPMATFLALPRLIMQSFRSYQADPQEVIDLLVSLADQARRDGVLSLEQRAQSIDDEFLRRGIMLVADGVDSSTVRDIMKTDLQVMSDRHESGISMLETMGGFSPAFGIIGTIMGVIQVLSNLGGDPDGFGSAIAVAFLTTLYGIFTANIIYLPTAGKLRNKDEKERFVRRLMIEGVLSIQSGQSPRIVREKLEAFLSPSVRGEGS